jgi:hypothetical protein
MNLIEAIQTYAGSIPAKVEEKKGIYSLTFTVAERKTFLSKQKLIYEAKFRIDENAKSIKFTEMLRESSTGMQAGTEFKVESYKIGKGGQREGSIEQQAELFGKKYNYDFDFKVIRARMESLASENGYDFHYQATSLGL